MRYDHLPYPVYAEDSPDYTTCLFNVDVNAQINGYYIDLVGEFRLMDDILNHLVDSGDASFALLIECLYTDHREVKRCSPKFKETIMLAKVANRVTVTPMIIANKDIIDYTHDCLNRDYMGIGVTVPQGAVMAFDDEVEITINRGTPKTVESVCKFKLSDRELYYDINGDSIDIFLPEEVFSAYKRMNRQERLVLSSIYFPPVLVQIVQDVYIDSIYDHDELDGRHWFTAINNALDSYNIDPSNLSAYPIAMELIGGLLRDGATTVPMFNQEVRQC